jgi:hypothetical protein
MTFAPDIDCDFQNRDFYLDFCQKTHLPIIGFVVWLLSVDVVYEALPFVRAALLPQVEVHVEGQEIFCAELEQAAASDV